MKHIIIRYILARLKEASTWRGIILIIAGGWATQNPQLAEAIIPIAIGLSGAIGTFFPDNKESYQNNQDDFNPYTPSEQEQKESETQFGNNWGDK